ncbi:unnamed protein product [Tilletia controversa]|uniref:Ribosomal RNA-processing protein 1 n=1 Tax=Tilletia controversa TaxID=13291 RepID=A0A8X7MVT2_9BASI|nr:hypothetical protein CF328_g1503 [Tilletia controversa]KAE8249152.1 hypothetical protein A4X06_0g3364 [Tilletia controversa]CAD6983985.1 unnamed protein product [Tilletia controversa]
MAPRTVKTSHGEAIGPLQAAELLRARRIAKGKTALTPEEEAHQAARQAGQPTAQDALPLGRLLASTEKRIRDGAIRSLAAFVSRPSSSSSSAHQDDPPSTSAVILPAEMAKLWKGIFYCFWMSDKPLVQQALASELAQLVLRIANPPQGKKRSSTEEQQEQHDALDPGRVDSAIAFLQGFWAAMAREWPLIDKHRVDKYLLLMRRFTGAGFQLCQLTNWDPSALARLNGVLTTPTPAPGSASQDDSNDPFARGGPGPLAVHDIKLPDSISYHVADIWVDELSKALATADEPSSSSSSSLRAAPLPEVFQPIMAALSRAALSKMYDRILQSSLQPLLDDLQKAIEFLDVIAGEDDDDLDDDHEAEGEEQGEGKAKSKGASRPKRNAQRKPDEGADGEEDDDFDIEELWEALDYPSLLQSALTLDASSQPTTIDTQAARPAKRAKSFKATRKEAELEPEMQTTPSSPTPSAKTLLSRARKLRLDIYLALRAAARSTSTTTTPANPARARSLEKLVRSQLSPTEDPEPQSPSDEGVLSASERRTLERKVRMERAKARILRRKRNVEMQAAVMRKAAERRAKKAKVASQGRAAAEKARLGMDGPVVIGPSLSRKLARRKK